MEQNPNVPDEYRGRCRSWYRAFRGWSIVYWALGLSISVGSVIVALSPSKDLAQYIAFAVAIASAINTFYQPKSEAERCRRAWIEMDCEIKRLEGVPDRLIQVARNAEDWLSGGATKPDDFTGQPGSKN